MLEWPRVNVIEIHLVSVQSELRSNLPEATKKEMLKHLCRLQLCFFTRELVIAFNESTLSAVYDPRLWAPDQVALEAQVPGRVFQTLLSFQLF